MHRFHVDDLSSAGNVVLLSAEESRHAILVLRLKREDAVELFDGKGKAAKGIVLGAKDGRLSVALGHAVDVKNSGQPFKITLGAAVIKPERMELLIQKTSELGVTTIVPLVTEHTVIKLSAERWNGKIERWKKIALESCKQCGRSQAPEIGKVTRYKDFIENFGSFDAVFIPTLALTGKSLYDGLTQKAPKNVLILIGPEGDFSKAEAEKAVEAGAQPIDLGPLVMRSETAALYVVSCLNFYAREIRSVCHPRESGDQLRPL